MDRPRLRILILTPQLPYPPRQGTSIRNYNLIRSLAQHHDVDLVTFLAPGDALTPDSPLVELCGQIHTVPQPHRATSARLRDTLLSAHPDMGLRLLSAEMLALIDSVRLDAYDIVQFEGIEMAPYGLRIASSAPRARRSCSTTTTASIFSSSATHTQTCASRAAGPPPPIASSKPGSCAGTNARHAKRQISWWPSAIPTQVRWSNWV